VSSSGSAARWWPSRRLPVLDPAAAREYLLDLNEGDATLRLIDVEIRMIRQGRRLVQTKSLRIKSSMCILILAIGLTAVAEVVK
jgi:hypothetical protein